MDDRGFGVTVSDTPIAFVQINLEFYEARQTGEITGRAYCLGLHLACGANYVTKRATTSVAQLLDDLGWDCSDETVRRHLAELRDHGFIDFEMGQGQRRGYAITVTPRLVYERTSTRLPHDFLVEGVILRKSLPRRPPQIPPPDPTTSPARREIHARTTSTRTSTTEGGTRKK